ncbi:Protein SRG1 [Linum perenne]
MEAPILQEREIVQEFGKEAPQKFFQKDIKPGIAEGTLPLIDLPVIDMSLLTSPTPSIALSEIQKLGSALSTYSTCLCCTETMKMFETVLKSMAKSLKLEDEECFIKELGEPLVTARFNYYPPCLTPDRVLGLNEHTDPTMLAFLLLDKEVEGTHILVDGQWFKIPVKPTDSFLIMMGDIGEIMSNGVFEASMHRGALNKEKTRQTMAIFFMPLKDKTVGPVEELLSEAKPARYLRVTNYVYEHIYDGNHRRLINSKMI